MAPTEANLRKESKASLLHKVGEASRFHGASEGACSQAVGSPRKEPAGGAAGLANRALGPLPSSHLTSPALPDEGMAPRPLT